MTAVSRAGDIHQGLLGKTWRAERRIWGISSSGTPGAAFAVYWATAGTCSAALQAAASRLKGTYQTTQQVRCCLAKSASYTSGVKIQTSSFWKIILWALQNLVRKGELLQVPWYLLEQHHWFSIETATLKTPAQILIETPFLLLPEMRVLLLHVYSVTDPPKHSTDIWAVKSK